MKFIYEETVIETSFDKDFEDGDLYSGGWTTKLVLGNTNWVASEFSGDKFGEISNFDGNSNSESDVWFISPKADLSFFENPALSFRSICNYDGADLKVYISNTYNGTSVIDITDWALLSTKLSSGGLEWVESGDISLNSHQTKKVYVAFRYQGSDSEGKTWKIDDIKLKEEGDVDPPTDEFTDDFESDLSKWNVVSVIGDQVWVHIDQYGNPGGCAKMTGYDGGVPNENEDWLITPLLDFSNSTNIIMTFDNATHYDGNTMKLLISNDYSGFGDPNGSNWTEINYSLSDSNWNWTNSNIDLSAYDGQKIYIAFKYTSGSDKSATWEIDNVVIKYFN